MSTLPLHLQLLQSLVRWIEAERLKHWERMGNGLEDREYQRHVGRIAELKVVNEQVHELMKGGLNQVEDEEESLREAARQRRAQVRRQPRH